MRPILPALAAALLLVPVVAANHECQPGSPEVTTPATGVSLADPGNPSNPGIYYVDNEMCQPDCLFSIWIYEETNGEPGLQRGDETCSHCCERESDTIIL